MEGWKHLGDSIANGESSMFAHDEAVTDFLYE